MGRLMKIPILQLVLAFWLECFCVWLLHVLRKGLQVLRTSCMHTYSSLCLLGKKRRQRRAADSTPSHMPGLFQRSVDCLFFVSLLLVAYLSLTPDPTPIPINTPFVVVLDIMLWDRGTRPCIRQCGFRTWKWPRASHFRDTLKHFVFSGLSLPIGKWGQHPPSRFLAHATPRSPALLCWCISSLTHVGCSLCKRHSARKEL